MIQAQTSIEIRRAIVIALRHGPLDMFQVAEEVNEPPYRVRGELKTLKRERLVTDTMLVDRILWRLTETGMAQAWERAQLRFSA
jgi:predicted transcriptional regulator